MDIPFDPKRVVGERVLMETSDKWRISSEKDNGDIQGNRYCVCPWGFEERGTIQQPGVARL